MNNFYIANTERKIPFLQNEHRKTMDILFKNACEDGVVRDYVFQPHVCQSVPYLELLAEFKKATGLDEQSILYACLVDLESFGFLMKTVTNPSKQYCYGITELGLKYMEYCKENKDKA